METGSDPVLESSLESSPESSPHTKRSLSGVPIPRGGLAFSPEQAAQDMVVERYEAADAIVDSPEFQARVDDITASLNLSEDEQISKDDAGPEGVSDSSGGEDQSVANTLTAIKEEEEEEKKSTDKAK